MKGDGGYLDAYAGSAASLSLPTMASASCVMPRRAEVGSRKRSVALTMAGGWIYTSQPRECGRPGALTGVAAGLRRHVR